MYFGSAASSPSLRRESSSAVTGDHYTTPWDMFPTKEHATAWFEDVIRRGNLQQESVESAIAPTCHETETLVACTKVSFVLRPLDR